MNVSVQAFRDQMAWLADQHRVVSCRDAVAGTPGVAITFDDGYLDNLTNAAPVLREYGLPASFFVVAARMGQFLDHDEPTEPARLMTWDQARELQAMGFDIGGHSMNHPHLSRLSASEQREEIHGCAKLISEHLGKSPEGFAYPFGSALDYTPLTEDLVREAGFSYALSNRYGVHTSNRSKWGVKRIWIDGTDTLKTFKAKVNGELDGLFLLDTSLGIRCRRAVNRLLVQTHEM